MPIYDYECVCGERLLDVYQPLTTSPPPNCPRGEASGEAHPMERIWASAWRHTFDRFSFDMNGKTIEVESLSRLREIERESEKQFRAGQAGDPRYRQARPFVFRAYSQNPSNRGENVFGRPDQPSLKDLLSRRDRHGRRKVTIGRER